MRDRGGFESGWDLRSSLRRARGRGVAADWRDERGGVPRRQRRRGSRPIPRDGGSHRVRRGEIGIGNSG